MKSPRIVYGVFTDGNIRGGHKMAFRHVETLCDLGFNAVVWMKPESESLVANACTPIMFGAKIEPDDIMVMPEDDEPRLLQLAQRGTNRVIIFAQGLHVGKPPYFRFDAFPPHAPPTFITVAPGLARTIARVVPGAPIELVPSFADERVFGPGPKSNLVAFTPVKRPSEAAYIRGMFERFHPRHRLEWASLVNKPEAVVAATFRDAALFLSLSRWESLGLTPLEAMASGCVCVGFRGIGGQEYSTPENGFWVTDDQCIAAADALAEAVDVVQTGGAPLARRIEAGFETARQWSYVRFRDALEDVWSRLAPEARTSGGSAWK